MIDRVTGMKERKVREAFAIEERKPVMNRDKGVEKSRTWNALENTSRRSHDKVPVFKFAHSLTTNITNFCSPLFLALAESVSVK